MFDVTVLGELLIDFTACGMSDSGMTLFERNPGGAVANVAATVSRLGASAAFIGKVGLDMHGYFLRDTLIDADVDVSGLKMTDEAFTTLAFVTLDPDGERRFSFARKPGADMLLKPSDIDTDILQNTRVLHVGSLSMTREPSRAATVRALAEARVAGAVIACDPNYRASLWSTEAEAADCMRRLIGYSDMMKISEDEIHLVTGAYEPKTALERLNAAGVRLAVVTLGAHGAVVGVAGEHVHVPAFRTKAVDATGAGDVFWGAFLARMLELDARPADITTAEAADCAVRGCAAAALSVTKRGGIPSIPTMEEVCALCDS